MTDMLHDLRPRFIVHATPAVAASRKAAGNAGVYDRFYGFAEVASFGAREPGGAVAAAERLAAKLNETPPTGPAPAPRAWGIVDALNARLA